MAYDTEQTKEQRQRMANREFVGTDPAQTEITYTIQVSGGRVWIHRTWEEEWEDEHGTGPDTGHECWAMSVADLKKLVECANWTIQKSEAFEAAHPLERDVPDLVIEQAERMSDRVDEDNAGERC